MASNSDLNLNKVNENISNGINKQYATQEDDPTIKTIFMNYVNSYHGKFLAQKILSENLKKWKSVEIVEDTAQIPEPTGRGSKVLIEIYGTIQDNDDSDENDPTYATEILDPKANSFWQQVLNCDIIIYDINHDTSQVTEAMECLKKLENLENVERSFILISSIMTWAQSKTSENSLTDFDYRKRRAHRCYNDHMLLEREVINAQKRHQELKTVVICPGIIYGGCVDILHIFFKQLYYNKSELHIFAPGHNYVPLIYIQDFVRIVIDAIKTFPDPKTRYILAVQPQPITMFRMISVLAEAVGEKSTRVKIIPKEEVFLSQDSLMTQRVFDHLILNQKLESEYLTNFNFSITGESIQENAEKLAGEYYNTRGLKPIKILIDGAPFTPQMELAELLANYYGLHLIKSDRFLNNCVERLAQKVKKAEDFISHVEQQSCEDPNYIDMMDKAKSNLEDWNTHIDQIKAQMNSSEKDGIELVGRHLLDRLNSSATSKHQGYILTGFQLDRQMATNLFIENTSEESEQMVFNTERKPDHVIIMDRVGDWFGICNNMESLQDNLEFEDKTEEEVQKDKMKRELKKYYDEHQEDVSLLNFFMDQNIIPVEISINKEMSSSEINVIFEQIIARIGPPKSYALTKKERAEIQALKDQIAEMEKQEDLEQQRKKNQLKKQEREQKFNEWNLQMIELKKKELRETERKSTPVKEYLIQYVLPNITDGLVELVRLRPENPVEFLAEYLFQQNYSNAPDCAELDPTIVSEFKSIFQITPRDKLPNSK